MLREWLSAALVLLVMAGGGLGWYAMDREGSVAAASVSCGSDPSVPHLRVEPVDPQPVRARGLVGVSLTFVNPTTEPIVVWDGRYDATLYRERWDGRLVEVNRTSEDPTYWEGYEGNEVPPGGEGYAGFVAFEPWTYADRPAGKYVAVVSSNDACGVGGFEIA